MTATGDEKIAAENVLTGTLKSLFALQESYPDLKANTNFMDHNPSTRKNTANAAMILFFVLLFFIFFH